VATIVLQSYVSLVVLGLLFLMCLGFARSGGIGAMDGEPAGSYLSTAHCTRPLIRSALWSPNGLSPASLDLVALQLAWHYWSCSN
jgi:hypothetical protein